MNQSDAKDILLGYDLSRPSDLPEEAQDALTYAESTPELSAWLEETRAFDTQFKQALGDILIPAGPDATILAVASAGNEEDIARPRFQRAAMLAVAAVIILVSGITIYSLFTGGQTLNDADRHTVAEFREGRGAFAAAFAAGEFTLNHMTDDLTAAKAFLDERGYPTYPKIPDTLIQFKGMGCRTIDWGGHKIGLVCFVNGDGAPVHLFIIKRDAIGDLDSLTTPLESIVINHERETGGWLGKDHLFLMVGSMPGVKLPAIKGFQ